MPRKPRAVVVGLPHHITQRGNNQSDVFFRPGDREVYLDILFDYAIRYHLDIWGYCLMTNHVHVIGVPQRELALSRTLGRTHSDYSRYVHTLYRGCGHLWQARFYSCVLERDHAWNALAYVERNPVRAALTVDAAAYAWSSARRHCGVGAGRPVSMTEWEGIFTAARWREVLSSSLLDEQLRNRLHEATLGGCALGNAAFVESVSQQLKRDLRWRRPGRPRKEAKQALNRKIGDCPGFEGGGDEFQVCGFANG